MSFNVPRCHDRQELLDEYPLVRIAAASALAKHGREKDRHLESLVATLNDPDPRSRWRAVVALGELGSIAESATERLKRLILEEENRGVRRAGIWALGPVGSRHPETKTFLAELQQTADEQESRVIADALRRIG